MTHNDMPPRERFNQGDEIPISIRQGAILVNDATVERDHGDCILVYVDLTSKYARLSATGGGDHCGPSLVLYADAETLDILPGKTEEDLTMIEFPTLVGWRIFSANEPQRYTLALTLVAPQGKL